MKIPFSHLRGSVRFSLSRETTKSEMDQVIGVLQRVISDLQASSVPMEAAYA
jgi:cysteine sulfinate desulfinase/cysteine desulfurase-like protein